MRSFKDSKGDTWDVAIHITAEKRLRSRLNFSLIDLAKNNFVGLGELLSDLPRLVDVLYVLCEDQCKERGISDEDFGRRMFGDTISHAVKAFLEELTDFFPDPETRKALTMILDAGTKAAKDLLKTAMESLESMDLHSLAKSSIERYVNSPESSGLTQAPGQLPN